MHSISMFQNDVPEIFSSLLSIHENIANCGVEATLANLIMLRVSQINQCGYCVELHTSEARKAHETNERLDQLVVFSQSNCFTTEEKLALTWAEKLTTLSTTTDYKVLRNELLTFYTNKQLSALTTLICMINTWNRIRKSECSLHE